MNELGKSLDNECQINFALEVKCSFMCSHWNNVEDNFDLRLLNSLRYNIENSLNNDIQCDMKDDDE